MSARILDGKALAAEIRNDVSSQIAKHTVEYGEITLCSVLVGDDPAGMLYAESQKKRCLQAGVKHELRQLAADTTQSQLLNLLHALNHNVRITGIMLHLPVPEQIDAAAAQYHIDPFKDVEGVNPANIGLLFYERPIIAPCTALAVDALIERSGIEIRGAHAVVVGQSRIVGKPVSMFLGMRMATVTSCHIATRDLRAHTLQADILVVAVGKPRLLNGDFVKPGAVVIDVGINAVMEPDEHGVARRRTVGDVDFASASTVAGAITPVPGGVGPVTVAMLLRNTVEAARKQLHRSL